ncbi:MAG: hypothetical protein J6P14_00290 [Ruminococcus sp.]|nr:hypothetical protein [Ruminococcus sp.]
MKKIKTALIAGAAMCLMLSVPMTASAATPEEAAEIARQYGYSEDMIQQGWSEYNANPELYPPEVIDSYIAQLKESGKQIVTEVPYDPTATIPAAATTTPPSHEDTQTTAAAGQENSGGNSGNGDNNGGNSNSNNGGYKYDDPHKYDEITLTMPDGTTFTRISKVAFISLSYEDKIAYLKTFTPEQQAVFIQNLSPEEYRSLMKQLPADKKMNVINELSKVTNGMGFTISVDEITDDNLIISMKNQDGELVAVGQARDVVEDTGYDRRGIFLIAAALLLTSAAGIFLVVKNCFGGEKHGV